MKNLMQGIYWTLAALCFSTSTWAVEPQSTPPVATPSYPLYKVELATLKYQPVLPHILNESAWLPLDADHLVAITTDDATALEAQYQAAIYPLQVSLGTYTPSLAQHHWVIDTEPLAQYTVLNHTAWVDHHDRSTTRSLIVAPTDQGLLIGRVSLSQHNGLHLQLDLVLYPQPQGTPYVLHAKRQLSLGKVEYIDSPQLSALILVERVQDESVFQTASALAEELAAAEAAEDTETDTVDEDSVATDDNTLVADSEAPLLEAPSLNDSDQP